MRFNVNNFYVYNNSNWNFVVSPFLSISAAFVFFETWIVFSFWSVIVMTDKNMKNPTGQNSIDDKL